MVILQKDSSTTSHTGITNDKIRFIRVRISQDGRLQQQLLDLLESYLSLFPSLKRALLFGKVVQRCSNSGVVGNEFSEIVCQAKELLHAQHSCWHDPVLEQFDLVRCR